MTSTPLPRPGARRTLWLVLLLMLPGVAAADLNEQQKLIPTANPGAAAGRSSAILGATAVVGAPGDTGDVAGCAPGAGAAYVFTRSGALWTKAATLCASDGVAGDQFGAAVDITSGNIAVGAPARSGNTGAVYVYSGGGSSWTQNATTLSAGAAAGGALGTSVSIQGFTVAAGAPHTTVGKKANTGVTIVYTSNDSGANWTHTTFRANGGQARTGSLFGSAVSLSGSTILVGAPGYHTGNKQNSGNVFIFVNNGSVWTQQANIRPANIANVLTGSAVSLFQNTAAFGAPGANSGKGTVYVYRRTGTSWNQVASVGAAAGANGDHFGKSVSIQGDPSFSFLAAGAPDAGSLGGKGYEFGSTGGAYSQVNALIATDNANGDSFGSSVDLNAGQIVAGAPAHAAAGEAYVFQFQNPSITKIAGFSTDPDPSLTGVPYTVSVTVTDDGGGSGTPTGSVHLDDSNGGSCDAPLAPSGAGDGHAVGSCQITSNFFGTLTMNASYGGDASFSASNDSAPHAVTGNHFAFVPSTPPNQLQGTRTSGVSVQLLDGANNVIASDSTTQVTLVVNDTCGDQDTIGTLTLTNGVADFTGLGPAYYTVTSGGELNMSAQQAPFNILTSPTSATSGSFDVDANADILFTGTFEDCSL